MSLGELLELNFLKGAVDRQQELWELLRSANLDNIPQLSRHQDPLASRTASIINFDHIHRTLKLLLH